MELLQRFAAGDLDAFESLFRQYQREVYGWVMRIVRDPATAEDLTVEAFWRAHKAHAGFDSEANFAAWLRRIATNLALDHLSKRRPYVELPDDLAAERCAKHLRNCRRDCALSRSSGWLKTSPTRKSRKLWASRQAWRERACFARCACCAKNCNDWECMHERLQERWPER